MYGLVNQAVEGLVTKDFGREAWLEIKAKAGFEDPLFVSMKSYDDSITYNLVGAASEILNIPADKLLEVFGEYWILYTAKEGYGDMLEMAGSTLPEFLGNLNHLHKRVGDIMPKSTPPSFICEHISMNECKLHYISKREGLNSMVIGLIKGLGKRFELKGLEIQQLETGKEGEFTKSVFQITWNEDTAS